MINSFEDEYRIFIFIYIKDVKDGLYILEFVMLL